MLPTGTIAYICLKRNFSPQTFKSNGVTEVLVLLITSWYSNIIIVIGLTIFVPKWQIEIEMLQGSSKHMQPSTWTLLCCVCLFLGRRQISNALETKFDLRQFPLFSRVKVVDEFDYFAGVEVIYKRRSCAKNCYFFKKMNAVLHINHRHTKTKENACI